MEFQRKNLTITDFVDRNADWYPDKDAVVFKNIRLSWGTFGKRVNRVATSLIRSGIQKGDHIVILNDNCLEYPEIMFGILKAGGVVVPVSTMLTPAIALLEMQEVDAKAVFFGAAYQGHILEYIGLNRLPKDRCVVIGTDIPEFTSYDRFIDLGLDISPSVEIGYDDPYNIIFSSGTTGSPKGIVHSHHGRLMFAFTLGLEFRVHNEAITLITTPFYTNGTQLLFLPTVLTCGTIVIMPKFDPSEFLELVQKEKCTHTFMVPTQFIRIMNLPDFVKYDTSSMEVMLSSAAPLLKSTKLEILSKFPKTKLVELYGVTEGISTILRPNEQFAKLGSVGKPRISGDIKIIDDGGHVLNRGEVGEIIGYNISVMKSYYNKPQETAAAIWEDSKGNQYLRTGDVGRLDQEGYLYILDRKKDMIISGGINIFSRDLEEVIMQHPAVAETTVFGIPHETWGETPLAIVVKKDAMSAVTEEEIRKWANNRLAKYQRITAIEFRDALPKNALGKTLKRELREHYWRNVA